MKNSLDNFVCSARRKAATEENVLTAISQQTSDAVSQLFSWIVSVENRLKDSSNHIVREDLSSLEILDAKRASQFTGLSEKTLRNLKCKGELAGHNRNGKKKGKLYFKRSDLEKIVRSKK